MVPGFTPGTHRLQAVAPGFLKLFLCGVCMCVFVCMCVCVCVCVSPPLRLLITSGIIWHDIDPI